MHNDLERLWADLLSEDASQVVDALLNLPRAQRQAALDHLRTMASETGWSEGQARRARFALTAAAREPRLVDALPAN
jgi:hypothetical protein